MSNAILNAALGYAANGFPVFPLNGKVPAVERGHYAATTDEDQIIEWWKTRTDRNIGIPSGIVSGLWVLDIDRKPHGPNGFKTLHTLCPEFQGLIGQPYQITSSGGHFFFRCNDAELRGSVGKIGPGIDVRANGNYIVASPSIHPISGNAYTWRNGRSIVNVDAGDAPEWLIKLTKQEKKLQSVASPIRQSFTTAYGAKALEGECQNIENSTNGNQAQTLNNAAFKIGKRIANGAIDEFDAKRALKASAWMMVNHDQNRPWSETEIARIIDRAISDGKRA